MWIAYIATQRPGTSEWRPMVLKSQVRCGSVYVTADDTTQKVTQTVVTATSVAEKKRRASKYTVAVGTSHGHVQAFLEDADSVLAALDQCQAEEKCLMLIKRPKEAARKMLKSHSLSNLSVSDPQLYRQFNGLQLSPFHNPGHGPFHKGKRSSDEQSVTSNDTDRSEPRRRYVSARGKENQKHQQQQQQQQQQQHPNNRSLPDTTHKSPEYYHSDSSSVSSDYQYVSRRDRDRERDPRRRDLRYSSIPEDAQEINNNGGKEGGGGGGGGVMYHSCHDLSFSSQASSAAPSDWSRSGGQGQGQGHGQLPGDKMYGSRQRAALPPTHDPGDLEGGSRSRSLGSLATGLTLSVVGQRKSDSMLDLSSPPSSSSTPQRPTPRGAARYQRRSEGARPYPDNEVRSPDGYVRSPRHSYPESMLSPRSSEGDDVFSPPPSRDASYHNGVNSQHHHHQRNPNHYSYYDDGSAERVFRQQQQQQYNGHGYNSGSSSASREETPLSDGAPPKPKRSLPYVPLNETSERIKRFTEMMRSRMSVCSSSAGRSTSNSTLSQTPTTPHTPPSRQPSFTGTDNGSDGEVSALMDARSKDSGYVSSRRPPPDNRTGDSGQGDPHARPHQPEARGQEGGGGDGRGKPGRHPYPQRQASSCQETPQPYGERLNESGLTPFTSHSHSSTMDSGYTTNTEGDGDSTVNSSHHHLSPPHHPPPPHHHQYNHPPPPPPNHHHRNQHPHPQPSGVPGPRNPSLAAARKFSSMQNVSVYNQHRHPSGGPHPSQSMDWGGNGGVRQQPGSHSAKGPAPMRAQHPAEQAPVNATSEYQRRSWDLAHNFKSLDFMPVASAAENGKDSGGRGQGREDQVVKPQAVSVNGHMQQQQHKESPRRAEPQARREARDSGQSGRRSDRHDPRSKANHAPPPPSHASEPASNTLPGHWKYNHANNNVNNNNNNNSNNNTTNTSNGTRPSPGTINTDTTPKPTLFQLSQSLDLCSVRLTLPADLSAGNLLSVSSLQVTLPCLHSALQSPQGRCARLGGPGSAFRPVRTGSRGGQTTVAGMVGVSCVQQQRCLELCTLGEIRVGDVMVEINGRQCLGMEASAVQQLLNTTQGELTLTVARAKNEKRSDVSNRVHQLENSLQDLQREVQRLSEELTKKDARIKELSTIMPWKSEESRGENINLESEEGAFVIGENEFVV